MKVRLTATAAEELDKTLSYIATENPAAARRVGEAIRQTIAWIARWPTVSPVVPGRGVRSKLVIPYQYRIYYEVDGEDVVVRNIRSTRQLRSWESKDSP